METGSIYITKKLLDKRRNRLGDKITPYVMNYLTNFEVDDIEDIKIIEWAIDEYC